MTAGVVAIHGLPLNKETHNDHAIRGNPPTPIRARAWRAIGRWGGEDGSMEIGEQDARGCVCEWNGSVCE